MRFPCRPTPRMQIRPTKVFGTMQVGGDPEKPADGREVSHMEIRTRRKIWAIPAAAIGVGALAAACASPSAVPPSTAAGTGSPSQLLNAGVAALNSGNTSAAETDFNSVLSSDPTDKSGDNDIADYDLGVIAQGQGNSATAETDYQAAIAIDPNYTGALYNLAIVETPSNPQGAITLYRKVIVTSPSDVNAIYNLGLLLYESGQVTEGQTYLKQAIALAPSLAQKLPASVSL
jgi:tetratricopeptide (TPR) repeat protein